MPGDDDLPWAEEIPDPPVPVPKCKGCGQFIGCTPEERKSIEDRGFCTEQCLRHYTIREMENRA